MTLTKAKLNTAIQTAMNISPGEASRLVETTFEIIKKTLEAGKEITISGFGKFHILDKRARKGRNPQTGGELTIAERRVVTFRASGVLKSRVNDNRAKNVYL